MSFPEFLPGVQLCRRFYWDAVRPLLDQHFPGLPHAAALIGSGSEVLGYDTPMSMDHDWHPRALLFLDESAASLIDPVNEILRHHLPHRFLGFAVDAQPNPEEPGVFWMQEKETGAVDHRIRITTLRAFCLEHLDWALEEPLQPADWLSLSSQCLLEMTAGEVFYDGSGDLTRLRQRLAWYPEDVWRYLLASGWQRISEEEHLMPRAGYAGDELGSAIMGSRLVRDGMNLGFLMEKQYAPYPKWFGSAFQRLGCAAQLTPLFWQVQQAADWQVRMGALCAAFEILAGMHNRLQLTPEIPARVSSFHTRPFQVIHGELFASALCEQIRDPQVRGIASLGLVGGLDQISDNTIFRSHHIWRKRIRSLYTIKGDE